MKASLLLLLLAASPARAAKSAAVNYCMFQETQWNLDQKNPAGRRGAQGVRARLFHRIKDLAVLYFENEADNPIAARTAAFLKTSTVTLRLDDLSWMFAGRLHAVARYDGAENAITSATDTPVYAAPDDAFLDLQVKKVAPSLPELAPTLVHEARHARDRRDLGALPATNETELLAYTDEIMYVWRRLQADPGYLGLDKEDAKLRALLGVKPHTPWWSDPIGHQALMALLGKLRKSTRAEAGDPQIVQFWVLLHSLAGGYEVFEGNLHAFGLLYGETMFSYPDRTLNYDAAGRRYLDLIKGCSRMTIIPGLARDLDILWNVVDQERSRRDLKVTYNQPYKNYFVQEIIRQKREVDALIGHP